MPCELGVASLSAPRPAFLGLLSMFCLGILAAGLWRVLVVDPAAFRIPIAVPSPLARLGGGVSWVVPTAPPSGGCSSSCQRFPRATSPGATGVGQEILLASPPSGDLQAPVLATLAESPFTSEAVQRKHSRLDLMLWRNTSCFASMPGRRSGCCTKGLNEIGNPRLVLGRG